VQIKRARQVVRGGRSLRSALFGCALGAGILASAPYAAAQDNPDQGTPPNPAAKNLDRVEITGSYIRRTESETVSPIQVINNDDIRRSGFTSIAEVLNSITANGQGTLSQGFSGAFAEGACGIALRGMTVGSTLVLLDGHRMAPYPLADDGQRSFVDICSLPLDAVDRVEVLKDGASATYGSDAIAGVVNVILKKSFQGATIAAENGFAQKGGGQTSHISGMFGIGDLEDSGQNAFVSLEYRHQDKILLSQRPYLNHLDYSGEGGQNLVPGSNNLASPVGTPTPLSTTGYFVNPAISVPAGTNPFTTYGYLPGCSAAAQTANQCTISPSWIDIVPETQTMNLLARGTKKLGADWEINLTASLFHSEAHIVGVPPFNTGATGVSSAGLAPGPGGTVLATISSTPGPFVAPVLPQYHLNPALFPVGSLQPIAVTTNDLGLQRTLGKSDTYRLVSDLKGSVGGWDIAANIGWSLDKLSISLDGFPIFDTLYNDLANGTYIPGIQNNAAVDASIAPTLTSQNSDSLWFTGVHGSRELFALPGGNLAVATGADFFFRSLEAVPALESTQALQATNFAYAKGNQSDWSVFGEVSAPVLKMLELDGGVRYDKYNTYSPGDVTPKIGFKFTPIQQLAVRGNYSKGFRAPNPVESQSSAAGGYFGNFADPVLCASGSATTPGSYPNQCSVPDVFLTAANPALKPEKSVSKTFGVILEPLKNFSASVDYYDITLNNQIYPGSEDSALVPTVVRGAPQAQPFINGAGATVTATPALGNILYSQVPYININSTEVRGLEFGFKNRFPLGEWGVLKSDFMWTHTLHYYFDQPGNGVGKVDLAGTHGPNEISGDTGNPRNRAKWAFTWEDGPVELTTTINYISGYSVIDPSDAQYTCTSALNGAFNTSNYSGDGPFFPTGSTIPQQFCNVPSFTDVDMYGSWQINRNWSLHASIDNLFDRKAPEDAQTYAAPNFNPSLHMNGAIGRFFTIGGRFTF
jgi:iron complex outermembrane receptor protein